MSLSGSNFLPYDSLLFVDLSCKLNSSLQAKHSQLTCYLWWYKHVHCRYVHFQSLHRAHIICSTVRDLHILLLKSTKPIMPPVKTTLRKISHYYINKWFNLLFLSFFIGMPKHVAIYLPSLTNREHPKKL